MLIEYAGKDSTMIPIGQPYRADGPIDVVSILRTLILGICTAGFAALAVWAWEISPIPTLILITSTLQGFLIGFVITFAIGRLKLRNVQLLAVMGFLCGLTSIAVVHLGHHIHLVNQIVKVQTKVIQSDPTLTPQQRSQLLERIDQEPNQVADLVLVQQTGHPGLIGSMIYRAEIGVTIKQATLTGWGIWTLWAAEAIIVAATTSAMAKNRASRPFCEDCHQWCVESPAAVLWPESAVHPLVSIVEANDPASLIALLENRSRILNPSQSGLTLHSCPICDQTFVDVWVKTDRNQGRKAQTFTKLYLTQVRISPEMTAVLRNERFPTELNEDEGETTEFMVE